MGYDSWGGCCDIFLIEVDAMNWTLAIIISVTVGFILWVIISAQRECKVMNSKKK